MLSVDEALALVMAHAKARAPRSVRLADALDLVLAEDVASDVDSPPHDKAIVDGYAVRAADVDQTPAELAVVEEVTAGAVPTRPVGPGQASRVMTGAPVPSGADAMIMIEQTETATVAADGLGSVRLAPQHVAAGQNIMRRASSVRRGEIVLKKGHTIRHVEVGALAEAGRSKVAVFPRPTVAVLPTGNELVAIDAQPGPGQIRNSNGPMLLAAAQRAGAMPIDLGIGRDDAAQLAQLARSGLEADILVISGGVSAGVLDLVPAVLTELGVEQVFHKLRLKPGKPLWFGRLAHVHGDRLVFGLPGNPVSSLVCFELFVRPAIQRLAGRSGTGLARTRLPLAIDHQHRGDRPTYHPARITENGGAAAVEPLVWQGSGDLRALVAATALIHFPAGDRLFRAGEVLETLRL